MPLTPPAGSLPPDYFEAIYDRDLDPWRFATSEYERRKYDRTLAAIGDRPIGRAWEVGCSIGVFTRRLAARCGAVLAVDVAEAALREAGARCAGLPNVTFRRQHVPQEWPEGKFDLIVFSEMLYYLSPADIARTARRATAGLAPQGRIVLVHWTGSTNYPCSGDEAAETFCTAASPELAVRLTERHKRYRIDVLTAHRAMGANATLDMPDED